MQTVSVSSAIDSMSYLITWSQHWKNQLIVILVFYWQRLCGSHICILFPAVAALSNSMIVCILLIEY